MKDYPYVPGWRQNKENNKPAIKHSVLMFTTHGIVEGEWVGNEWVQYRWSCKVKDIEVLYWMHLEDLTQLEKEGDCFQQEQPVIEEDWVEKRKQECGCRKLSSNGNYQCERYEGVFGPCDGRCSWIVDYPKLKELEEQEQPEVDFETEYAKFSNDTDALDYAFPIDLADYKDFARHFYELGLNARKEK